ncbi:MAG TPA: hypothetical protein VMP10_02440, partial [Chloroflexota bacterium]|nr:hypothetical protein [Chloroflexota bacterium]
GLGVSLGKVAMPAFAARTPTQLPRSSGAHFADQIVLESYQLSRIGVDGKERVLDQSADVSAVVAPGEHLRVQMVWRATRDIEDDLAVFNHLLDFRQKLVAQDDEWPRRGLSPTSLWLPGQTIGDEYRILIPRDAAMGHYDLNVGFYRRSDFRRLPLTNGEPGPDRLSLGTVKVAPAWAIDGEPVPVQNVVSTDFGGIATLLGYDDNTLDQIGTPRKNLSASVGGQLDLTLYWRARERPAQDYTVFIHAIDANGTLVAQADGQPGSGGYPTSIWDSGEVVTDRHVLTLPPGLPAGTYQLAVGLYLLETGERLRIASGQDRALLDEFTVTNAPGP